MSTRAIHLIWTTYMTWPPGDPRGHWSPLFDFYGHLIQQGHQLNLPDPPTVEYAMEIAHGPEKRLCDVERQAVADMIGEMVDGFGRSPISGLKVYSAAIEPTHVHLLISPIDVAIGTVVGTLKGRTSSAVLAESLTCDVRRTWTSGYWKVFLFNDRAVAAVQEYVEAHHLRRGAPRVAYPWVRPWGDARWG